MLKSVSAIIFSRNFVRIPVLTTGNRLFSSDLSLDKLYPNSSLKITTPSPVILFIFLWKIVWKSKITPFQPPKSEKFNGFIPMNEIEVTYSRSSGPGGQNVNMVNTKVDLRFKFDKVTFIPEEAKKRLMEEYKHRVTKDGYFVIKSELTRYQTLNLADALEKLRTLIRAAETPVKKELSPETASSIKKRIEKAKRERLFMKRHRSQVKADRRASEPANI